jgi:hypothetical protein
VRNNPGRCAIGGDEGYGFDGWNALMIYGFADLQKCCFNDFCFSGGF